MVVVNEFLGGRRLDWVVHGVLWLLPGPWYVGWPVLVIGSLYLVVGGLWMLGEFVHLLATQTTTVAIRLLEFIEARTLTVPSASSDSRFSLLASHCSRAVPTSDVPGEPLTTP